MKWIETFSKDNLIFTDVGYEISASLILQGISIALITKTLKRKLINKDELFNKFVFFIIDKY